VPLDTTIGQVFALYRPTGRHGNPFLSKKLSYGIVKLLFQS
jgi:hypothetical protein